MKCRPRSRAPWFASDEGISVQGKKFWREGWRRWARRKRAERRTNRRQAAALQNERNSDPGGRTKQEVPAGRVDAGKRVTERAGGVRAGAVEAAEAGETRRFLGTEGCGPGSEARGSAGADRSERRRENHAAEDFEPHHAA